MSEVPEPMPTFGLGIPPSARAASLAALVEEWTVPAVAPLSMAAAMPAANQVKDLVGWKPEGGIARPGSSETLRLARKARDDFGAFVSVVQVAPEEDRANSTRAQVGLSGVPVAIKDNIAVQGLPLTASSEALSQHEVATSDALIVERLRRAGAWIVGKTALDEFAFGTVGPGITNPAVPDMVVGGSSGGSAAAVSAGACPVALGTDTGGSVRIPAACTGIVGFKPTSGWFSNEGIIPLAWSLDTIGILANSVVDVATAFGSILGWSKDQCSEIPSALRVAIPHESFLEVANEAVRRSFQECCDLLGPRFATVATVDMPSSDDALNLQYLIALSEAAAYHSGLLPKREQGYSEGVRSALQWGHEVPAVDYIVAQRARYEVQRRVEGILEEFDLLMLPTMPIDPPLVGHEHGSLGNGRVEDVVSSMLRYTSFFNHTGHPAISIPIPTKDGIPRGLQFVARRGDDDALLQAADLVQMWLKK